MSQMSIPIQGTFDVAKARNALRKEIASQGWLPSFSARAAAMLTALTELILLAQASATLEIVVIHQRRSSGIEIGCDMHWLAAQQVWLEQVRRRLERLTDEFDIFDENSDHPRIVVRLWLSEVAV